MSILGGMFSGVTAVAAQSQTFGIISDNISNMNTIGYKDTDGRFSTLVTESGSSTKFSPGGVISRPFTNPQKQGILQASVRETDLAVVGNGFFVVNASSATNPDTSDIFTRAGAFVPDEQGNLKNTAGYFLKAWRTDSDGNIINSTTRDLLSSLDVVSLANFASLATPTTEADVAVNLPANVTTGSTETTNLTIFDSLGTEHLLQINWTQNAIDNRWDFQATLSPNGTGTPVSLAADFLTFDGAGNLATVGGTAATDTTNLTITAAQFGTGANATTIALDWGTIGASTGMRQLSAPYSASLLNQNGSAPSALTGLSIDQEGLMTAQFANGLSRAIYQIPIATLPAVTEMKREFGNAYSITAESGEPTINIPQQGGAGLVQSGALEGSTVDLSEEFTDLIITQRAFSAATRVITTGDELLDEVIRIKR